MCSLCGEENVAPVDLFSSSNDASMALVAPIVEYRQDVNLIVPEGTVPNSRSFILVLDANLPVAEIKAVVTALQTLLLQQVQERGVHVQLALVIFNSHVSIYQLGITGMASADVYTCSSSQDYSNQSVEEEEEALIQRRLRMENRSYFVNVTCEEDLATLWLCVAAVYGIQVQEQEVNGDSKYGADSSSATSSEPLSRKEKLRLRKEARLRKELSGSLDANDTNASATAEPVESPWTRKKQSRSPLRCTGEATQCAVDLAIFGPVQEPQSSRILLFTNGCPNVGVGSIVADSSQGQEESSVVTTPHSVDATQMTRAVEYFQVTGKYAMENGIGMDVFCTGAESLGIPAFQALVKPSEGYALSHDSFASLPLVRNLSYVVSQTQMSIADCGDDDSEMSEGGNVPLPANQLEGCIADVRISRYVIPWQYYV